MQLFFPFYNYVLHFVTYWFECVLSVTSWAAWHTLVFLRAWSLLAWQPFQCTGRWREQPISDTEIPSRLGKEQLFELIRTFPRSKWVVITPAAMCIGVSNMSCYKDHWGGWIALPMCKGEPGWNSSACSLCCSLSAFQKPPVNMATSMGMVFPWKSRWRRSADVCYDQKLVFAEEITPQFPVSFDCVYV